MDCKVIVPSIAFCFTGHLRGTKHRLFGLSNGLQPTQPINQSLLIDVATLAMSIFYIHNLKQHVHWSIVVWQRPKRHTKQTPDCVRSWWGGQLFWALPKCCDRTLKTGPMKAIWHTRTHTHTTSSQPFAAQWMPKRNHDMIDVLKKGNGRNDIPIASYSLLLSTVYDCITIPKSRISKLS